MSDHARESKLPFELPATDGYEQAAGSDGPSTARDGGHGSVLQVWVKRAKRGPMDRVNAARLEQGRGITGNANRGGRRQVTIIASERWSELMAALGANLDPSVRRANLLVSGIDLQNSRGRVLRIGATRVRINGETRPCERMEEARAGLPAAMRERWGGGAFAEVIDGGDIHVGDSVTWESMG